MNRVLQFFENNPWLNIIFLILSILGIFLAYYFYKLSLREKKPLYDIMRFPLFSLNPMAERKIEIRYGDRKIDSLFITKLSFWNAGKDPIRASDFVSTNTLRIIATGAIEIFDLEFDKVNVTNNVRLKKGNDGSIEIYFDYLDFNEGFILNVFHSFSDNSEIKLLGKFIGAQNISYGNSEERILDGIGRIINPFEKLVSSKWVLVKILGVLARLFAVLLLFFPLIIIGAPVLLAAIVFFRSKKTNKFLLDRKSMR